MPERWAYNAAVKPAGPEPITTKSCSVALMVEFPHGHVPQKQGLMRHGPDSAKGAILPVAADQPCSAAPACFRYLSEPASTVWSALNPSSAGSEGTVVQSHTEAYQRPAPRAKSLSAPIAEASGPLGLANFRIPISLIHLGRSVSGTKRGRSSERTAKAFLNYD